MMRGRLFTLVLAVALTAALLGASIYLYRQQHFTLVDGLQPAPPGSAIALKVIPSTTENLVAGQQVSFTFEANYTLNAESGTVRVFTNNAASACEATVGEIVVKVHRGSGNALAGMAQGALIPDVNHIEVVALLGADGQRETSTKATVVLPVRRMPASAPQVSAAACPTLNTGA